MSLSPGTRLGPYEIIEPLGAGGMGEVYRARDTRLNRPVAIKISKEQFSERFEREAHAVASLNHPHICTLYDVGPNYLVMELVDGVTLAERIAERPLEMAEILAVAREIAEALQAAHDKGVIHRDLKPANVKLTAGGQVKVLDFGLAKMIEAEYSGDPAVSPTLTMGATRGGVILGTASYMAPEQARGAAVDKRADIWAFGGILFEMLTGGCAFDGDTITEVLAAVVRAEPNWSRLPADTPASIRRLLKRCLEKDRKRRLPDIGAAILEIDDAAAVSELPSEIVPDPPRSVSKRRLAFYGVAVALALVAAVAVGALWQNRRAPPEMWSGVMLGGPARAYAPRLSPDGQLLAFLAFIDRLPQVGVMKPDGGSWTMLTDDRSSGYVATIAWAADGSKIYFDRYWGHPLGIYSVPPLGGEPRLVLDDAYGPEPLSDGSLIVTKLVDPGDHQLFRYQPDSRKLDPLPAFLQSRDVSPIVRAFPDGKEIVYFGWHGQKSGSPKMWVLELAGQRARELSPGIDLATSGSWGPLAVTPDGSVLVLAQQDDSRFLMSAQRHGAGPPRLLLSFTNLSSPFYFDAARDGSLYLDQMPVLFSMLRLLPSGAIVDEVPVQSRGEFTSVASLPDGKMVTTAVSAGRRHLMVFEKGKEPHRVIETTEETTTPATDLAGGNLAFILGSGDQTNIAIASLRDGRVSQRFPMHGTEVHSISASPDGRTLFYSANGHIWVQPVSGGEPRKLTQGTDAAIDKTGRFLFVKRARKGAIEIFRVPVKGGEAEAIPVPVNYHLADSDLSSSAVDSRGRVLVTVNVADTFYYRPAILDPASRSVTLIPVAFDGDVYMAGWTPDGEIAAFGGRYISALWRYRPLAALGKK